MLADSPALSTAPRDLTCEEVGELIGCSASTVRGWLITGDLQGFKLNGRDWRIPPAEVEVYRARQAAPKAAEEEATEPVDIAAWRKVR